MRAYASLVWLVVGLLVLGCEPESASDVKTDTEQAAGSPDAERAYKRGIEQYQTALQRVGQSLPLMAEPLRSLTEEQHASLAALLIATRTVAQQEVLSTSRRSAHFDAFWAELRDVCPPLPSLSLSRGGCVDELIAYASATAECESVDDADCENTWGPAAGVLECQSRQLQKLASEIRVIRGRPWPPQPLPWEPARDIVGSTDSAPR
jgi:hypothetical protein